MFDPSDYLTSIEVAMRLKVSERDILQWIEEGKLTSVNHNEIVYITPESYNEFTSNNLTEIFQKVGKNLWESSLQIEQSVKDEVNERFRVNSQIVLERSYSAVNILEDIHRNMSLT